MAKKEKVIFTCECGCKQPLPASAHKSVKCLACDKEYAIVNDGEGNAAMVPYFNQGAKPKGKKVEQATA